MSFPSPTLSPPALANWQFYFNGWTFGASQTARVAKVQGLGDLATVRHGDVGRPRDHGELVGLDVYGGRDVTIDLQVQPASGGTLQSALLAVAAATEVGLSTEQPLWFQVPNYPLLCVMCRARKRTLPWDVGYQIGGLANVSVQFHATDPRVYTPGQSLTVGLPTPTAGLRFPVTFPISFGSSSPNGVTVVNGGNTETRPVLVITGPVTNPTVQNASISGTPALTFTNPTQSSYTVNAGDQLVVDLDLHTVLYYVGGVSSGSVGASRRNWVTSGSVWWNLPPGSNLVQFFSGDSSAVGGTCQVQYASAYQL